MSLRPTTGEVLDSVIWSLEHQLAPALVEEHLTSTVRTITNLVRHVRARIELEPPALVEDNAAIRALLESARASGLTADDPTLDHLVETTLRQPPICTGPWPRPAMLAEEAERLRSTLDRLIVLLDASGDAPTSVTDDPVAGEQDRLGSWRGDLESYLEAHLGREATWETDPLQGERR